MFDKFDVLVGNKANCELLKNNLQSQPVNLITNLAFFISGWAIYRLLKKHKIVSPDLWWLFYGTIAIGTGSTLRHYNPNATTLFIDGLPMLGFMLLAVYLLFKYFFIYGLQRALLITFGYLLLMGLLPVVLAEIVRPAVTFSLSTQFLILPLAVISYQRHRQITGSLVKAGVFFVLAETAFIVDLNFCSKLWFGTHFLWHIFNGVALYFFSKYLTLCTKETKEGFYKNH